MEASGESSSRSIFSWIPTSESLLQAAESRMLEGVTTSLKKLFVKLSNGDLIRTVHTDKSADVSRLPLVLLHGFAAGLGFWTFNIDHLSKQQNVYAIDLLGFGRSSRPNFPSEAEEVEKVYVDSIEEWRQRMGLNKFVLCGHSFGGYLACAYALKHPENISHLVLADPWGFPEQPPPGEEKMSRFVKVAFKVVNAFNPLAILRAAGPYGPSLISRSRRDIQQKFEDHFGTGDKRVMDYIYHCNAKKPSGEAAFKTISDKLIYAKNPMIERLKDIDESIPITVIYGKESWMMKLFDFSLVRHQRKGSYVEIKSINDSGHHIYLDQRDVFNEMIEEVCTTANENTDPNDIEQSRTMSSDTDRDTDNVFLIFSP